MRPRVLNVLPECYVDTNLIEFLLDSAVNHQHCCSKVVGQLNTAFADRFAIGIIDKDKVELGYIRECYEIAKTIHLTLLKHKNRPQYLITITPAIDRFILDCAKAQGVETKLFQLPSDIKGFTRVSKSITSNVDDRFKRLFSAIHGNVEIMSLKKTLEYLCSNQYKVDEDELRDIFLAQ